MQQPLALTIIAGLSSSTLLTLVVIPVVYALLTRWLEGRDRAEVAQDRRATRAAALGLPPGESAVTR